MTPQEALRTQIERNERAIQSLESKDVDKKLNGKLADEGRAHVIRELRGINQGLKEALEAMT